MMAGGPVRRDAPAAGAARAVGRAEDSRSRGSSRARRAELQGPRGTDAAGETGRRRRDCERRGRGGHPREERRPGQGRRRTSRCSGPTSARQVFAVLTPEQQAKAKALRLKALERIERRRRTAIAPGGHSPVAPGLEPPGVAGPSAILSFPFFTTHQMISASTVKAALMLPRNSQSV